MVFNFFKGLFLNPCSGELIYFLKEFCVCERYILFGKCVNFGSVFGGFFHGKTPKRGNFMSGKPECESKRMLLLTNFEAIQQNIWTAVLTYGPNEMRSVQ